MSTKEGMCFSLILFASIFWIIFCTGLIFFLGLELFTKMVTRFLHAIEKQTPSPTTRCSKPCFPSISILFWWETLSLKTLPTLYLYA
jgi:hypothetical protein